MWVKDEYTAVDRPLAVICAMECELTHLKAAWDRDARSGSPGGVSGAQPWTIILSSWRVAALAC
jgi:hypothetical protein